MADKFSLQPSQLKQKTNEQQDCLSPPDRHVLGQGADSGVPARDRPLAFSGKHHTTVLHSINKIEKLRQRDPDLNSLIHSLIDSIH